MKIENIFLKNGFSKDEFVVGTGTTFTKKAKNYRFEFSAKNREQVLNKTAKYAVKYFAEQNFYILWKLRQQTLPGEYTYRTMPSIGANDAYNAYEQGKMARKGVTFKWRLEEYVAVVDFDSLEKIIHDLSQRRE